MVYTRMRHDRMLAIEVAVVGTSLLLGNMAAAAELPSEFTGVWIRAADSENECTRTEWKGPVVSRERLISVTPRSLQGWGTGCHILSVKQLKSFGTIIVEASCGGHGADWQEEGIWHVQTVENRRMLVKADRYFGKVRPSPEPNISLFLECR